MDEEETKNCPNCKREIPAVNFTIHTVHCARNIKVCPVCKEPVPGAELDDHHKKLHKLLPCKQCGESVCGTDLEDHIRDSCANTIKSCRFCSLELPRGELPAHEGYCGARTERCAACGEYVMSKYRQLHLDSNHGFLRLDDDPAPVKEPTSRPAPRAAPRPLSPPASAMFPVIRTLAARNGFVRNQVRNSDNDPGNVASSSTSNVARSSTSNVARSSTSNVAGSSQDGSRPVSNGVKKRTNDQPQINTDTGATKKIDKVMPVSRGAVKKRPAPAPPRTAPAPAPLRDFPYYSAMQRKQDEERTREQQNAYNLAHGLPPVLSPADKIEKLRKLDALQNFDGEENREIMRREERRREENRREEMRRDELRREEIRRIELNREESRRDELRRDANRRDELRRDENRRDEPRLEEFKDLKPMSTEQFLARFSALQLAGAGAGTGAGEGAEGDRFTEIKSSLRELRRGLNEVTAPYNNNNNNANNNNDRRGREEEVRLPCEFCDQLVLADDLVQHQTGCRPDLAQYWGAGLPPAPLPESPPAPRAPSPAPSPAPASPPRPPSPDPVIPCEFCARSLPVYLITEHQERCAREVDILSAD